jgi:hypothetical protein
VLEHHRLGLEAGVRHAADVRHRDTEVVEELVVEERRAPGVALVVRDEAQPGVEQLLLHDAQRHLHRSARQLIRPSTPSTTTRTPRMVNG